MTTNCEDVWCQTKTYHLLFCSMICNFPMQNCWRAETPTTNFRLEAFIIQACLGPVFFKAKHQQACRHTVVPYFISCLASITQQL